MDKRKIAKVADAVAQHVYKNTLSGVGDNQRKDCRVIARTIVSAHLCRQSAELAAKRLATWHWVDHGKDHVEWEKAPGAFKNRLLGVAEAGYAALA